MAVSNEFLDYIVDQLSGWRRVTVRKMFGGAGIYCEGKMFALVNSKDVAYLKVDDSNRAAFEERGSRQFQPFPDKPAVMPYYEIPSEVLEDRALLAEWAQWSLDIALKQK